MAAAVRLALRDRARARTCGVRDAGERVEDGLREPVAGPGDARADLHQLAGIVQIELRSFSLHVEPPGCAPRYAALGRVLKSRA